MKGSIRIGGALTLGAVLILGAFWVSGRSNSVISPETQVVVAAAPERTHITTDKNGDGIQDWEEELRQITAETSNGSATGTGTPRKGNTLTDRFSKAFLQDYLEGKMQGKSYTGNDAFVANALDALDRSVAPKVHTVGEQETVPATTANMRAYGNELVRIMNTHSAGTRNELVILNESLKTRNPALLEDIAKIKHTYEKVIMDTATLRVPETMTQQHTELLNAYERILVDVTAMQLAYDDPMYTLARMDQYRADAKSLYEALRATALMLSASGIQYSEMEAGKFFNLFMQ